MVTRAPSPPPTGPAPPPPPPPPPRKGKTTILEIDDGGKVKDVAQTAVPPDGSGLLPLIVRRAEEHAQEIARDGRLACSHTGSILDAVVILVKLLLAERRRTATERERLLLQLLVDCHQVALAEGWGDGSGATGLCDCRDRDVVPYQSETLSRILETAGAILRPIVEDPADVAEEIAS